MPPGLSSATACCSRRFCSAASGAISASCRSQADVGMAADRAGRGAGRVDQDAVEAVAASGPCHSAASATTVSASSESRVRLSRSRAMRAGERSTAVTRAPASASCAVLPPGAAQRSAMDLPAMSPNSRAGSAAAASCTHQWPSVKPGSIVTEPCSSVRTVPVGSISPCSRLAHCSGSDFTVMSSEGSWPIASRDVARDGSRRNARSSAPAARAECPASCALTSSISGCALARAAAQHGVDEAGIFRGAPVRLHQPHRQIDRGVVGHVHPEDLRGADQQRALRARRVGRNAAIEQPRQQMAERAEPAQDGRHQPPHQRAVAIGQCLQSGMRARRRRAVRPACGAYAARRREYPPRSAAPPDQAPRMAARIVEQAWSGNISRKSDGTQRFSLCHREGNHFCHANMPNIRIALPISLPAASLCGKLERCAHIADGWRARR